MENSRNFIQRNKFDFEIGYLVKSPCLECPQKDFFPKCHKNCKTIDSVQEKLAEGISCYNSK